MTARPLLAAALALWAAAASAQPALIPVPLHATWTPGAAFVVGDSTRVLVDPGDAEARAVGDGLAALLGLAAAPAVAERAGPVPPRAIVLTRAGAPDSIGAEGYVLDVTPDRVTVRAATAAGLFYGVQTLRQALPPSVEYAAAYNRPPLRVPAGRVVDRPRFGWRGAMLDVARHFFSVEDVQRTLDVLALYKLNVLHLHLSDDQGWRIEVPGWPALTAVGGSTEVGGGPGGFYTTEDYRAIVAYAAERFITVVPEIDLPGHTNAALASYPELNCDGEARPLYTGVRVGFSAVCVESEATYRFVDAVVGHLAAHTPGPFVHIGGDEVRTLSAEQYAGFMDRAQAIVGSHGKRVVGWDEIAEVELVPGAVVQVWRPQSAEARASVAEAVAEGATVVLSPSDRIYLDIKYDSTTVLGLTWAGLNGVRDAYEWDPAALLPGVPETAIEGVEAPLWSETLETFADVTFMALPRLAGVAEIGWSAPGRDWTAYRQRLGAHAARWTVLGLTFYRAPEVPWRDAIE